jgi:DNA modification methylase
VAVNVAGGVLISDGEGVGLYIQDHPPKNKKIRHIRVKPGTLVTITHSETTTTWEVRRDPAAEYLHPTQKPPELAERAIDNSTLPGEIVLDCFLGAGGTLIAAERLGRQCRGIELDPKYVAVTLERASLAFPALPIEKLV